MKSLKTDTKGKIDKLLEPHKNRPEWPQFYGEWELSKILKHLPDGEELNKKILEAITTSIKEIIRKANRQIRETKRCFGLSSAGGVLVILNEFLDIFTPQVLAYKVQEMYQKLTSDREFQIQEINFTWIISEAHYTHVNPKLKAIPGVGVPHVIRDDSGVARHIDSLQPKWAESNKMPLISAPGDEIIKMNFHSVNKIDTENEKPLTRHEFWRKKYRAQPYLQNLSREAFIKYTLNLMDDMAPGFLIGATEAQKNRSELLLQPWTDVLEEINLRGMDLKEFRRDNLEQHSDTRNGQNKR